MKVEIPMPKLGESLTEGTIIKWNKKVGDKIEKEEILLEISTDKVDTEIPSPVDGTLVEILFKENQTVPVGTTIAIVETGVSGVVEAEKKEKVEKIEEVSEEKIVVPAKPAPPAGSFTSPEATKLELKKEGVFFSPLVLSIARKENISMDELLTIVGTGAGGRVTKKDVLEYLKRRKEVPVHTEAPVISTKPEIEKVISEVDLKKWEGKNVEIIPMDIVKQKMASHMRQSVDTSPHVYSVSEVDMTRVMNIISSNRDSFEREMGFKLTVMPFIIQAVTKALIDYPLVNSSIEGRNIIQKKYINIGMAVATDWGLIVPVIKHAEEKSFRGIARSAYDLAVKARNRKLVPDDVADSTFSITNYGVFGKIMGFPIINQPNVAILGVGAIKKRPVVVETPQGDSIAIRSICYLTLSFDHRLIDGELAGRFMSKVEYYLEHFEEQI